MDELSRPLPGAEARERILALYARTRAHTESLSARLTPEDQQLQSMADASPTKWHRAHTTWFFETFVLEPAGKEPVDPRYAFLFNSYYEAIGPRHVRARRGVLSRPSVAEIGDYRRIVDDRLTRLLATADAATLDRILPIVVLGIAHEEQHQELLLTDILHAFSENPLCPAFAQCSPHPHSPPHPPSLPHPPSPPHPHSLPAGGEGGRHESGAGVAREALPASGEGRGGVNVEVNVGPIGFVPFEGGLLPIGAAEDVPFAFDNERPRHKAWVEPFALADRLVTVHELKAFLRDGGYRTPSLWLAEGFDFVRSNEIVAPLYCTYDDGEIHAFSLAGSRIAADDEPIAHLSYYEADAIARFLGSRLPTEAEWEIAAARTPVQGNFVEEGVFHTRPAPKGARGVRQLFGDAWEWTGSSYDPYPGYQTPAGALGEYNGKFMINQRVLRGGSCLTPQRHMRASYRNFWHPHTRFQMAGLRLVREVSR